MTRTSILLLLVCGGVAARLQSQTPSRQVVASISGNVVDAQTGEPIASAAVFLQPLYKPQGSCGVSNFGDGRFLCEVYEGGEFTLSATHRGYSRAAFGMRGPADLSQPFDLAAGERVTDVTLRMWKNGVVSGRAIDAEGDPIVGKYVYAIGVLPGGFVVRPDVRPAALTDDRGMYRLADLVPGNYVIVVKPGSPTLPAPPIFHPNVISLTAAKRVTVAPGADLGGIDLAAPRTPTFTVSGRLLGRSTTRAPGFDSHPAMIRLLPADAPNTPYSFHVAETSVFANVGGAGARDQQGAFAFTHVPPGKYVVRIVDYPALGGPNVVGPNGLRIGLPRTPMPAVDTMWAEVPVTVTDRDVTDLPVTLRKAARLSGRVVFDPAFGKQTPGDAPIILIPADAREDDDLPFGVSDADGTFRTVAVPPGPYTLIALSSVQGPTDWRMTSVSMGGREVADLPIDIGTADITDVVVTMRRPLGTLTGVVRDDARAPQPDASLYIFSTDRSRWLRSRLPSITGAPREIRPNRHGNYRTEVSLASTT